ncbi:hypothetical protein F7725_027460 [Dissostichus mawsoni]|uniref:Uncharacterized protein n=1 Tax=Dissostichus mawsoni TaxID=36200 RepID=A0A7J5XCY4_DISMA|nr:hypothetical protein F7725_027460 [Dissostichus mawsoni]
MWFDLYCIDWKLCTGGILGEKDLDTELGDAEGTLMRCGQSLLVGILLCLPEDPAGGLAGIRLRHRQQGPLLSPLPNQTRELNGLQDLQHRGPQLVSAGFQNCSGGQVLGMTRDELVGAPHVNTSASGVCTVGSAVSENAVQPFNNEDGSSPLALSPSASRHSARLLSASSLRRRCLSLASQSSAAAAASVAASSSPSTPEEINITAIICSSSQMSMVACVNGFRSNLSPSSAGFSSSSSSSSSYIPTL